MDESEVVKAGMEVVLRPVIEITENVLGLAGGDWLSERRARNRAKLKAKTEQIFKDAGIKPDAEPSPTVVIPLLSAAQDEGREEILNLWASLLAAASDPARQSRYRREFVGIIKQLEPIDAVVLQSLAEYDGGLFYEQRAEFAQDLEITEDQLDISLDALRKLGLIAGAGLKMGVYEASSLARELCLVINPGESAP